MTATSAPSPAPTAVEEIKKSFGDNLTAVVGKFPAVATRNDRYLALAHTVRDRLVYRWMQTQETYYKSRARSVGYLSAEYLLGTHTGNNLVALGLFDEARRAIEELGYDFDGLLDQEEEPGLGNGGLGRLAACFMDSLATLQIPTIGYGIRYEFGIFDQAIRDGWQVEVTDQWLHLGNPWEIPRPEIAHDVSFGGRSEVSVDASGRNAFRWVPTQVVRGIAHDTPIPGYRVGNVNLLRLWKAEASQEFDFAAFNQGDYYGAVEQKIASETISKVLYPNDDAAKGKLLRLKQQHFFVSCSLQDMVRLHLQSAPDLSAFHKKWAIQLNDTHPSLAIAELMRLLLDVHGMSWDEAWQISQQTFAYTNHTLLPEALEKWPVAFFEETLPRHLEIVYEINRRFLDEIRRRFPADEQLVSRVSLIDESAGRSVRMAHLAVVGSHHVNGVAALHSELLKKDVMRDFATIWPEKFTNVTNGVTPRRFIALANPGLTKLITSAIGDGWVRNLEELKGLEPFADDAGFREDWRRVKRANRGILSAECERRAGVATDPDSLFDVQIKRIHEYKRQHLNVLHAVTLLHRLRRNAQLPVVPRTILFAGKAAPGYAMAKWIIKLIHSVAEVVNADPAAKGRLKVVFLPDYNVKNGLRIFPGADLSEQISTAGKEASGTGNMKLALNGALTIGTLDGANVEIRDAVGPETFFLFGLTAPEVERERRDGYRPRDRYQADPELRDVLDWLVSGDFSRGDRELFRPLVDSLINHDPFFVLADYRSYVEAQAEVEKLWRDPERWTRAAILNVARMGGFSSDRSINDYARKIWGVVPVPVPIPAL